MLPCKQQGRDASHLLLKVVYRWLPEALANPWVVLPAAQGNSRAFAAVPARATPEAQHQKKAGDQAQDWRIHTRSQFSIRPSLMSPLFPIYQAELQKHQRAQVVRNLLDAHNLLATEVDGIDAAQVERNLAHRSSSLLQLAQDLRALATRQNLATCDSQQHMLAFYSLLDKQLVASTQPSTPTALEAPQLRPSESEDAADAQLYHDVASGKLSIWDAWANFFEQRYENTPSLEPMDMIYSQHQQAEQQSSAGMGSAAVATQQASDGRRQGARGRIKKGARMDVSGTVLAEGKRKNSVAKVLLRQGSGNIIVNGLPYDAYFTELSHRLFMLQPLMMLPRQVASWDIAVDTHGRGKSSQAQAARTAIARALLLFKDKLNSAGRRLLPLMARWDGRRVERKKPGKRKARKSFTYVRR